MNTSRFDKLPISGFRYRPPFARRTIGPAIARNENVQTDIQRGIIHQVAPNATSPTTCSVILNGTLVPRSGFSLEPGVGPFYQSGTHPSGPFYNDPATNTGGTLVEVNTRAMTAKILQGTGAFVPDSSAWAVVGGHVHTGGTDPTTGNPLPSQVDINAHTSGQLSLARLASNPSPATAPVLASTGSLSYISPTGSGSYDAAKPFTLSFPTGYAGWLADVRLLAQPAQSGHIYNAALAIPKGALPVVASGVYTGLFGGLAAHQAYDLFVAYLDGARGLSTPVWVDTTSANPMVVGQGKQAAMPGTSQNPGGTLPTPNVAIETAVYNAAPFNGAPRVYGVNSSTVDFSLPFYADDIGTTDTLWLGEIQLIASITTQGKWQQVGLVAPAASISSLGHYVGIWAGLGAGNTYDVAVRYIDFAGNTSNILSLGTYSVPPATVTSAQLPSMPNGTTVSASTTLPIPAVNYNTSGSQPSVVVPITLTISDSQWLTWLNTISILVKQMPTGTTAVDGDTNATNFLRVLNVPAAAYVSNPLIVQIPLGASVNAYEISVQLLDKSGLHECHSAPFAITSPQLLNGPSTIGGLDNSNLVADSDMSFTNGSASASTYGHSTYWTYSGSGNFGVLQPGTQGVDSNILAVSTGTATYGNIAAYSEPINVIPGQLYTATVSWATTNVVSGNFQLAIVSVADKTANNSLPGTVYQGKALLVGASGNASGTSSCSYQVPASGGPTQVVICLYALNVKANFYWAKPQFEMGATYSGYKKGPAALVTGNSSYGSSSTQTQAVIKSDGTADPSKLNPAYGNAPHAVMPSTVKSVISDDGAGVGKFTIPSTPGYVLGNLPYPNMDGTVTRNINSNGQGLATDFLNVVEADPSSAQAGLWVVPGGTYSWSKNAQQSTYYGPMVYELSGYGTSGDLGLVVNGTGFTGNGAPTAGYMCYVDHNSALRIYKMVSGSWVQQTSVACTEAGGLNDSGGYIHHLKVTVQPVAGNTQIWMQFDRTSLSWTDASGSQNGAGRYALVPSGTFYIHDWLARQSAADVAAAQASANVDLPTGNFTSGVDFTKTHIGKTAANIPYVGGGGQTIEYLRPAEPLAEVTTGKRLSLLKGSDGVNIVDSRFTGGKPWINPNELIHIDGTKAITQDYVGSGSAFTALAKEAAVGNNVIDNAGPVTLSGPLETNSSPFSRWFFWNNDANAYSAANDTANKAFAFVWNGSPPSIPANTTRAATIYFNGTPTLASGCSFPCSPGEAFTIGGEVWAYVASALPAGVTLAQYMFLTFYDVAGNYVGGGQTPTIAPGSFTSLTPTLVTAPANAKYGAVGIYGGTINSNGTASTPPSIQLDYRRVFCRKAPNYDTEVAEGSTYLRMPGSNMDSNRRGLIDGSQTGHVGGAFLDASGYKLLFAKNHAAVQANVNSDGSTNASTPNLAPNSDFSATGGANAHNFGTGSSVGTWPQNYAAFTNNAACTFSIDAAAGNPFGKNAAKIVVTGGGGAGLMLDRIAADGCAPFVFKANTKYVISFYAKANTASTIFTAGGVYDVTITAAALSGFPTSYADTAWHRYAFLVTVGNADTSSSGLALYTTTSNVTAWLAAPQLEEGSVLSVYSGSLHQTIDLGLPWANKDLGNLTNRTADKVTYTSGGVTVDTLKPQEAGANVTENRNSNGVAYSGTVVSAQSITQDILDRGSGAGIAFKRSTPFRTSGAAYGGPVASTKIFISCTDNGNGTSSASFDSADTGTVTLTWPDGTVSTCTNPTVNDTLTNGTTYYYTFRVNTTTLVISKVSGPTTAQASLATVLPCYADGYLPLAINLPITPTTGFTKMGSGGGGFGGRGIAY